MRETAAPKIKFKAIKALTIDCNTWYRGQGYRLSRLLTKTGKRCCLGFECQARGIPDNMMLDVAAPSQLTGGLCCDIPRMTRNRGHLQPINDAMPLNDSQYISDEVRMSKLTALFKKRGIKLRFINVPKAKKWRKM